MLHQKYARSREENGHTKGATLRQLIEKEKHICNVSTQNRQIHHSTGTNDEPELGQNPMNELQWQAIRNLNVKRARMHT